MVIFAPITISPLILCQKEKEKMGNRKPNLSFCFAFSFLSFFLSFLFWHCSPILFLFFFLFFFFFEEHS